MKRIKATWLIKEGYNEIKDRDVDLDEYQSGVYKSIDQALIDIKKYDLNGIGIIEIQVLNVYQIWETVEEINVSEGVIY